MIFIAYKNGEVGFLHIGDYPPDKEEILRVSEIQADCDELDVITSWGYPNHGKRVQRYIGETAQQILLNW